MIKLINFLDQPVEYQKDTRNWRNQENVAKNFKIKYISESVHNNWLDSLKEKQPKNIAFFIEHENEILGVTYFHSIDYSTKQADWGIYIHKEHMRGKGIGTKVLTLCSDYAKKELCLRSISLDVLSSNTNAIKVYENENFIFIGKDKNGFLRYIKEL